MLSPIRLLRRVRSLVGRRHRNTELRDELAFHLDMETAKLQRAGLDEADARSAALRSFGSVSRFRDETRDSHGVRTLEDFLSDMRRGVRALARQRSFAAVAILTLAIGIGGTTAVFGAVYSILLAPLPYRDAERIVTVWQSNKKANVERGGVSPANFLDWRERSRSFTGIAAAEPYSLDYIGADGPVQFSDAVVTEGYFDILGARPLLGRTFVADEFQPGRDRVIVLGERIWRTQFGSDTSIVGRTIVVDSIPRTVIGIMPLSVDIPFGEVSWTPKIFREDERTARTSAYWTAIARLREGTTLAMAQQEMSGIAGTMARENPSTNSGSGITLVGLKEVIVGQTRGALLMLLGAVGFVLLIACANVANLQLAQSVRRRQEMAIRTAIGAGRERLIRQLIAENTVLAVIGGALGVVVAYFGIASIRALAPINLPRLEELRMSGGVLVFAASVTLAAMVLFALVPVLQASLVNNIGTLSSGTRGSVGTRQRRRANRMLVVGEMALALVLLVGAGLLGRSFNALMHVDRGFQSDGISVVTVQTWSYYPTPEKRIAFRQEVIARLSALPGVKQVGTASSLPLAAPIGAGRASVAIEGRPAVAESERPIADVASISDGYLEALQVALRAGRFFDAHDGVGSPPVVIVNEAFARLHWPGESALGKRVTFRFMGAPLTREVIGVAGNMRHDGLDQDPQPAIFVPHGQAPTGALHIVVRSLTPGADVQRAIRRELVAMNGVMPLSAMTTLDALLAGSVRERRFHLVLLGAFSVTALLLATVGIYGVMSHATSERVQEIGVRIAVGARPRDVMLMVVQQGTRLALAGILIGALGAAALSRFLGTMLFAVTPLDPFAFLAATALLLSAATLACWLPARRAASIDPLIAMRRS